MRCISKMNPKRIRGRVVLVRVDLNIEEGGEKNAYRIQAILPTILHLLRHKGKVVLLSHRGRPKSLTGIRNKELGIRNKKLSLRPFAGILSKKLGKQVSFVSHFNFEKIETQIESSRPGSVFLLENLRFLPGEEKDDSALGMRLAALGDVFVNDAFAVSHRANASVHAIIKYIPSYAGLLLEKEVQNLDRVAKNYTHPFAIIFGGAKISDKMAVIQHFRNKADYFLIGGGPANTFFAAQGLPIGDSLVDVKSIAFAKRYLKSRKIILPVDAERQDRKILDVGPKTVGQFGAIIKNSKTIIWNGPMGFFEMKGFEKGTRSVWKAVLRNKKATVVAGGGELLISFAKLVPSEYKRVVAGTKKNTNSNLFLSTGGGAMLEYLSGKKLPGIEVLRR